MESSKILALTLFATFMVLISNMECQTVHMPPALRPLCISQFALANHACSILPITPHSPPSPPSPVQHGHRHHGHGHGHGHRHSHHETSAEGDCCRWLKEVDNECVCDVLVRLPVFLSRPVHEYSVMVDSSCNVTFACGGRLRA